MRNATISQAKSAFDQWNSVLMYGASTLSV